MKNNNLENISCIEEKLDYFDIISSSYDNNYKDFVSLAENDIVKNLILNNINKDGKIKVLDLGCGTGLIYDMLSYSIDQYVGVDISEGMLNNFRLKYLENNFSLIQNDLDELDINEFEDNSFDLVVSTFGSFSYVNTPERFLFKMKNKLKKGGIFFLMVYSNYSFNNLKNFYLSGNNNILLKKRPYNFRNDGISIEAPLANFYTCNDLSNLSKKVGFNNFEILGLNFFADSLKNKFYSLSGAKDFLISEMINKQLNMNLAHSLILIMRNND